jgi:hypothetical protein
MIISLSSFLHEIRVFLQICVFLSLKLLFRLHLTSMTRDIHSTLSAWQHFPPYLCMKVTLRYNFNTLKETRRNLQEKCQWAHAINIFIFYLRMVYLTTMSVTQIIWRWMPARLSEKLTGNYVEKKRSSHNTEYFPGICMERMKTPRKNSSQNSRYFGQNLDHGLPKGKQNCYTFNHRDVRSTNFVEAIDT